VGHCFHSEGGTQRHTTRVGQLSGDKIHAVVKNVMASREALDSFSTTKSLRIYWVPSQQGNETADVLAKEGVELTNDRTEIVPISLQTLQSALEKQADMRAKSRWRNTKTCRISRIMCKERNDKLSHYVLHLSRKTADC